ncbi:MAG: PspC domain-containing protein [Defluviitaleaceae bacterium]|nr:PspC domain-containing protein [Defluviitaleaceae bacterium]
MTKRLYKSQTNKTISGVCGGIGEYFNADPSLIRILWVLATLFTGGMPGIIAYIACAIILPEGTNTAPPSDYHGPHSN